MELYSESQIIDVDYKLEMMENKSEGEYEFTFYF